MDQSEMELGLCSKLVSIGQSLPPLQMEVVDFVQLTYRNAQKRFPWPAGHPVLPRALVSEVQVVSLHESRFTA